LSLRNAEWLERELERALPAPYFHGVLTLPPALRGIAQRGDREARAIYGLLFRAGRSALAETAEEELGERGRLGLTLILHTWNARFGWHPHLHAIVTAGALSPCGTRWLRPRSGRSLFPLDVLRARFRAALLAELAKLERGEARDRARAEERGERAPPPLATVAELTRVRARLGRDYLHVFAKATLSQEEAFQYVARYTSRGGFSNARLESHDPETGAVVYRSKHGDAVACSGLELAERFLKHLLPRGFHRIRRYELLAPRNRTRNLAQARAALGAEPFEPPSTGEQGLEGLSYTERFYKERGLDLRRCPRPGCEGHVTQRRLARRPTPFAELHRPPRARAVPP
jgi:hypothetical protein